MKTTEKPATKIIEPHTARDLETEVRFEVARAPATPVMYDKYPGTKGRTHGDKNEIRPAANASGIASNNEPEVTTSAIPAANITYHSRSQLRAQLAIAIVSLDLESSRRLDLGNPESLSMALLLDLGFQKLRSVDHPCPVSRDKKF